MTLPEEHKILPDRIWQKLKKKKRFSEDERMAIHLAQVGVPSMQRGITIDLNKLNPYLRSKVVLNFEEKPRAKGAA